ncbi:MAG: iron-containing redox enzyme family protein [Patescibacteria group bacterium]
MKLNIQDISQHIANHKALNNDFYDLWCERKLTLPELQIFARNYGAWVKSFPDALAILFRAAPDVEAKNEYVKTLYSEMGYGNSEKIHWKLLDYFFSELAIKLGAGEKLGREYLEKNIEILAPTKELIAKEQELYGSNQYTVAVGAQMALEWQAYTMLRKLYDGARNYIDLWDDPDKFHEACEYFYVHIGSAEKDHKIESLKGAEQYATSPENTKEILLGLDTHLDLIANFWTGISKEIA